MLPQGVLIGLRVQATHGNALAHLADILQLRLDLELLLKVAVLLEVSHTLLQPPLMIQQMSQTGGTWALQHKVCIMTEGCTHFFMQNNASKANSTLGR